MKLLHDPQSFSEKLFSKLKSSNERFEIKLMMMELISRCIGTHELLLLNFYPFLQKYLSPHQKEVTKVLAAVVQASHAMVPPDCLTPIVVTLATKFVSDRCSNEAMAIGLNTIREICARQALVITEELLHDLAQYKSTKEKGVAAAARSLIALFRELCPALLHKKDRGKGNSRVLLLSDRVYAGHEMDRKLKGYGELDVHDNVDGAELLDENAGPIAEEEEEEEEFELDDGQDGEEEGSEEADDEEEEDAAQSDGEEVDEGEDDEQVGADDAVKDKASEAQAPKRSASDIIGDRILTEEDFAKIRRRRLMQQVAKLRGANKIQGTKRKLDELEDMDEAELEEEIGDTDAVGKPSLRVDASELHGWHAKKKLTKAERVACIMEGREGREKFGRKNTKGGGSTNKAKAKRKNLMMALQSDQVQNKSKRTQKASKMAKLEHRARQRSKARTKRNDTRSKKKK